MKIRTDFVTNSSSSSFVLAHKGQFTDEQKDAVMKYIEDKILGEKILEPDFTEEEFKELSDDEYWIETREDEIREALKSGKNIYLGTIDHDEADWNYCKFFIDIWKILEKTGHGNFEAIQDDLSY